MFMIKSMDSQKNKKGAKMAKNPETLARKLERIYWLLSHIESPLAEMKKLALDIGMFELAQTIDEIEDDIIKQLPDKIWLGEEEDKNEPK